MEARTCSSARRRFTAAISCSSTETRTRTGEGGPPPPASSHLSRPGVRDRENVSRAPVPGQRCGSPATAATGELGFECWPDSRPSCCCCCACCCCCCRRCTCRGARVSAPRGARGQRGASGGAGQGGGAGGNLAKPPLLELRHLLLDVPLCNGTAGLRQTHGLADQGHRACVSPGPYADARALDEGGCWKKTLQILLQRWDARNFLRDAARKGGLGLGSGFPPGMSRVRSQLMYAGIQHGSRYAWSRA